MERLLLNSQQDESKVTDFATLITCPEDWVDYQKDIDKHRDRKYTHFGIPRYFPCLVISIEEPEDPIRYFEHRFLYPDAARVLLEQEKINHNRFNLILHEWD